MDASVAHAIILSVFGVYAVEAGAFIIDFLGGQLSNTLSRSGIMPAT